MKLLEKKTINEAVQAERKSVIDSGIFLATKVDTLRQDLLNLEKQRADFIESSRKQLQEAITDLKSEKGNLESEVKEAIKQLEILREPLDEEWAKVQDLKEELESAEETIRLMIIGLATERNLLSKDRELFDEMQKQALIDKKETEKLLRKAEKDSFEANSLRSQAQNLKDVKESDLYIKELNLEAKEKNLKTREETLKKERLEFNKEKKLLEIKKQRIS